MPLSSTMHTDKLMGIKDVQVFKTGTWNGKTITSDDLDNMVDAFTKLRPKGVAPFLKLGHDDEQVILNSSQEVKSPGTPAAGWVENLKRVGNALYCDFVDIPKKIFEAIQNKAYKKVSIELLNNFTVDGEVYPKFMYAVSLLGAELPAVSTLDDILARYSYGEFEKFAQDLESDIITIDESVNEKKDVNMDELEKLKFQLGEMTKEKCQLEGKVEEMGEVKAALEALKLQIATLEKALADSESSKMEMAQKVMAAEAEKKDAKLNEFVAKLSSENLISKAMEPFVKALIGEEKETYAVGEASLDKFALVTEVLKLGAEAAKVSFSENTSKTTSSDIKKIDLDEQIREKMEKDKISYRDAYSIVTKGMDLPAKPISVEE